MGERHDMTTYVTKFGSLDDYTKGEIDVIHDNPKHYAFSNIFEVASSAKPWEKVAVGKNMEYVLEVIRAEGTSEWRTCAHDEFPLCMDGEVQVELVHLDTPLAADGQARFDRNRRRAGGCGDGSHRAAPRPHGAAAGELGLPVPRSTRPSVILLQTILGDDTVERWAEICLR